MRAVVADDSSTQRNVAIGLLRDLQIEVVAVCADGRQAWDAILEHQPDIALLDFMMPHMSGGEVASRIIERKLATKILFATSMGQKAAVYQPERYPGAGVLIKPFTLPLMANAIAGLTRG